MLTEAASYMELYILSAGAEKNSRGQVGGMGLVGLAENKANSAPLELELGLSLTILPFK